MPKYVAYIDITVRIESESLARFLDYMEITKEELETAAGLCGEILEYEVREGVDEDEDENTESDEFAH